MDSADPVVPPPRPYGPVPSPRQLRWHGLEYYGFLHFSINTFTGREWGYGDESPALFAPTDFDADQIAGAAAEAGMAGLILTCKHHDGFCLWPSKLTEHSVKHSPWKKGKGDVVREVSEACARRRIGFGIYLSPWDRHHAAYGQHAYLDYFRGQLQELTTGYGELFEVWFDGANGGDGFYGGAREGRRIDRQFYYEWEKTRAIVRRNQPQAALFSDAGPDVRWVGNEEGLAGDPCWSTIDPETLFPGIDRETFKTRAQSDMVAAWDSPGALLQAGNRSGRTWLPAECDVSIRPGWFYHSEEDDRVRSPGNLLNLYFQSVGRGASLLLNVPPDRRGRIHEKDLLSLQRFRKRRDRLFADNRACRARCASGPARGGCRLFAPGNMIDGDPETYWATDDDVRCPEVILEFSTPVTFNVVSLREYLPLGQRVDSFAVDVEEKGGWREWIHAAAIGPRRLVRGAETAANRVRLRILESAACPAITEWGLSHDPHQIDPPTGRSTRAFKSQNPGMIPTIVS